MEFFKNEQRIVTISPGHNPGSFLEECVSSLVNQRYNNFKCIFVDDFSSDNSFNLYVPKDNPKVKLITNQSRKTALENLHNTIINECEPEDIVAIFDSDDFCTRKDTFKLLNEYYNNTGCFLTWGQSVWSDGRKGFAAPYTKEEYENIKLSPFKISHLRTFKAGLYHRIGDQDKNYDCLRDSEGKFYLSGYDTLIYFALCSLCPFDKTLFIPDVTYFYRLHNRNDHFLNQELQTFVHREASLKPKLKQIQSYLPNN